MVRRTSLCRSWRGLRSVIVGISVVVAFVILSGCGAHFTVSSDPIRPEDATRYSAANPEIPVRVQVVNFEIREVDAKYPEDDKNLFRRHFAIAIPNMIQEQLGNRKVFSEVVRVSSARPESTDYVVTGTYDFFERLGTQGREWIPFAGTFGARINEAWIRENLSVRVTKANSVKTVLERSYLEEHRDKTSIYHKAYVGYLQTAYIARICTDIINSIKNQNE